MRKDRQKKTSKYLIILLCLLLLILVFVSGILLGTRLIKFVNVEPYTEIILENTDDDKDKDNKEEEKEEPFVAEPGLALLGQDDDGSFSTDLSIFRATYGNQEDEITVRSLGGE